MIIQRDVFLKLNKSLQVEFQFSVAAAARNAWVSRLASETDGRGVEDVRAFLAEHSRLRAGKGVAYFDLEFAHLHIAHQEVSGGFVVEDRDLVGEHAEELLKSAVSALGESALLCKQSMVLDIINANAKAYDGLPFFATGHFVNYKDAAAGVYDNDEAAKDLTDTNLAASIAKIEDRKMPDGTPRMLKARWLLHPPSLKKKAIDATGAEFLTDGTSPIYAEKVRTKFGVVPVTVPGLAQVGGKDAWIVAADDGMGSPMSRPFGISTLLPARVTDFDGITAPHLARAQQLEVILSGDFTAYPGHPFLAHRCALP